jgi:chromosome segregation ATPase
LREIDEEVSATNAALSTTISEQKA